MGCNGAEDGGWEMVEGEEEEKEVEEEDDALADMGLCCSHGFCAFAWMRTEERREKRKDKYGERRGERCREQKESYSTCRRRRKRSFAFADAFGSLISLRLLLVCTVS